jgi:4-amino-4-deoxy-L-arabinose transferase-like glycosyltransferase
VGNWSSVSPLQVLLLITSPIFTILTIHAAGFHEKMRSPYAALATWLIGMGLAVIGALNWTERLPLPTRRTMFWFVIVTLWAFLVRGISTGSIPILLTGDEASMGVNAVRYAKGEWDNLFITGWFSFPTFFYFLQSFSIRIFGDGIEALRIPSALIGALTVGTVYWCGKIMFGHRAGLFASLILASIHLHIHFSRLGLNNIWDGLWFTLTIAMLWHGWKTQTRWAYLLAGFGLGFSQYFYASSKALIGVVVLAGVLALIVRRERFRKELSNICAMLLVAWAIFIPLGWYYANEPKALLAPFARASMLHEIGSSGLSFWKFLSQQLPSSLGAYIHTQFTLSSYWYPSETPLLLPIAAMFFLIGLFYLSFHHPDSRSALLVLWLFIIALGNALSSIPPVAQRYVAAAPACALVAGFGLHKIAEMLAFLWSPLRRIVSVLAYMVLGCIMIGDLWFYFFDYTPASSLREMTSNGMVAHQFGNFLNDQPANTQVVFFGVPHLSFDSPALLYLAPQIKGVNAPEAWNTFDQSQLTSSKIIFVFRPEYRQDIAAVQKDYPGGRLSVEKAWNGDVLYWVYERDQ